MVWTAFAFHVLCLVGFQYIKTVANVCLKNFQKGYIKWCILFPAWKLTCFWWSSLICCKTRSGGCCLLQDCSSYLSKFYFNVNSSIPVHVSGTDVEKSCPNGTFGNQTGLKSEGQCSMCTPGYYCEAPHLQEPTGLCDSGYFI